MRSAAVRDVLDAEVAALAAVLARPLDVVDVGGGTGGFAVPLAQAGHRVTVVDPSPDALAALQRRSAEAQVSDRIRAVQGDAGALVELLGAGSADVVLCHGVLEYTDDPGASILDAVSVLRPRGLLSLLLQQRLGALLARALAGRFTEARRLLADPQGRGTDNDPVPRRFDQAEVLTLLEAAGIGSQALVAVHGVRLFTDLLPGSLVDADPAAAVALLDLERAAGSCPELAAVAAQLHVLARV